MIRYPLYRRLNASQGRSGRVRKISFLPGFDSRNVQPVERRYTDWAKLGRKFNNTASLFQLPSEQTDCQRGRKVILTIGHHNVRTTFDLSTTWIDLISIIVQQVATMHSLFYFCKLLYIFRVVTPPIIRSTYNCNYSIWHWSNLGKFSVWSQLKMRGMDPSLLPSAIVRSRKVAETGPYLSSLADFTHCIFRSLTSARCCNYGYMCSWWWVELPPEICRTVYRNIINCT